MVFEFIRRLTGNSTEDDRAHTPRRRLGGFWKSARSVLDLNIFSKHHKLKGIKRHETGISASDSESDASRPSTAQDSDGLPVPSQHSPATLATHPRSNSPDHTWGLESSYLASTEALDATNDWTDAAKHINTFDDEISFGASVYPPILLDNLHDHEIEGLHDDTNQDSSRTLLYDARPAPYLSSQMLYSEVLRTLPQDQALDAVVDDTIIGNGENPPWIASQASLESDHRTYQAEFPEARYDSGPQQQGFDIPAPAQNCESFSFTTLSTQPDEIFEAQSSLAPLSIPNTQQTSELGENRDPLMSIAPALLSTRAELLSPLRPNDSFDTQQIDLNRTGAHLSTGLRQNPFAHPGEVSLASQTFNQENTEVLVPMAPYTKQYPCDMCPNRYQTLRTFKRHFKRKHGVDPRTPCGNGDCPQAFSILSELRKHRRDCLKNERIPCPFEEQHGKETSFVRQWNLDRHLKRHCKYNNSQES